MKEINTQPSWVEVDPLEIWQNVLECIQVAVQNLVILDINPDDICALALTNRRDTTVIWHKVTGRPLYNAIGNFESIASMLKHSFNRCHRFFFSVSNSLERLSYNANS